MAEPTGPTVYPDIGASLAASWDALFAWIDARQGELFRALVDAIGTAAFSADVAATFGLISAGILYGVFHAIGPGPGKAVLAAYLVTHPATARDAMRLGLVAALMQGVATVAVVLGRSVIAPWFDSGLGRAVTFAETASASAVALVGLGLALRAGARLHRILHAREMPPPPRTGLWLAIAIGLRPDIVGTVVLLSAHGLGFTRVGLTAVAAMAAGTGITVALMCGCVAVSRGGLARVARVFGRPARLGGATLAVIGGFGVSLIGAMLLDSDLTRTVTAALSP